MSVLELRLLLLSLVGVDGISWFVSFPGLRRSVILSIILFASLLQNQCVLLLFVNSSSCPVSIILCSFLKHVANFLFHE